MSHETVRLERTVVLPALVAMLLMLAHAAGAQTPTPTPTPSPPPQVESLPVAPLPRFAFDVRGGFASIGTDTTTSAALGISADDMPKRLRTVVIGAHVYLFRQGGFKLGIGAEAIRGVASGQRLDSTGEPTGPVVRRRLAGVSGQLSLNFGKSKGWSYFTAGSGPMKFESYLDEAKPTRAGRSTLNYGGGARWSFKSHVAVNVDLRFYLLRPTEATSGAPPSVRKRVTLLSAGISIK